LIPDKLVEAEGDGDWVEAFVAVEVGCDGPLDGDRLVNQDPSEARAGRVEQGSVRLEAPCAG